MHASSKGHTWRVLWDFRHMHTQDLFHARPWLLPRDGAGFVSVPTVHAPLGVAARLPKPLSEHRVDSDAHLCSSGPRAGLPIMTGSGGKGGEGRIGGRSLSMRGWYTRGTRQRRSARRVSIARAWKEPWKGPLKAQASVVTRGLGLGGDDRYGVRSLGVGLGVTLRWSPQIAPDRPHTPSEALPHACQTHRAKKSAPIVGDSQPPPLWAAPHRPHRSADIERLTVSKYVHNWTGRVRVGHG